MKTELQIVTEETLLLIEFNQDRLFGTFKFEFIVIIQSKMVSLYGMWHQYGHAAGESWEAAISTMIAWINGCKNGEDDIN